MRIEIICTGDEVLTGKIVNTNFSYMSQKLEDFGLSVAVGDDRRRRPRRIAGGVSHGRRARRRGHRQWRARPHGRRSVAGDRGTRRRGRPGAERGLARSHGGVFPPAQPGHVGKQPQAGDAAARCRNPRQPGRHRLRLCARHRQGAVFLHPRRAARALPHARGADHPAPLGARRDARRHPPEALSFLWARRIACRPAARRGRGPGARRQRQARLSQPLSADRDQADGARRRPGRHRAQAGAGAGGGAQAARQFHPRRGRRDARRRRAGGAGRARRLARGGRDLHRRPDRGPHRPPARRREGVPPRLVARDPAEIAAALGLEMGRMAV